MTAIKFAAQKHFKQLRKDKKTPFVVHPLTVAIAVNKVSNDENVLIAALLHDVIEDTITSIKEIENKFGKKVATLVLELTHDMNPLISKIKRKENSIEKIKFLSTKAAIIKYCDILCNNQELVFQLYENEKEIRKNFNWSMEEKLEYEYKRLQEFKIHHKNINIKELENCLKEIEIVLNSKY